MIGVNVYSTLRWGLHINFLYWQSLDIHTISPFLMARNLSGRLLSLISLDYYNFQEYASSYDSSFLPLWV